MKVPLSSCGLCNVSFLFVQQLHRKERLNQFPKTVFDSSLCVIVVRVEIAPSTKT